FASARHAGRTDWSVGEDAPELLHDLFLAVRLGDGELLHEEVPRRVEHLALAEGELLVALQDEQVAQHLGDFQDAPGLDLLRVFPITAVPGLLIDLHLLVAQDLVDLGDHVLADDTPQPDRVDVLGGDHDGHVAVDDAEYVELALAPGDHLGLNALDHPDPMGGIDDLLPNLERSDHAVDASGCQ